MSQKAQILASWEANAKQWIDTIERGEIESRLLATNQAIVDALLALKPASVLDVGCGEGWLTRTLRNSGIETFGVDATAALVQYAKEKDGPIYAQYSYAQLATGERPLPLLFEAAVANFALIDQEETETLLTGLHNRLQPGGLFVIQTLHPYNLSAGEPYCTGWKDGSWQGLKQAFVQPYQWYFRTMADWLQLFGQKGWRLLRLQEPLHPELKKPLSVIFVLQSTNANPS